jgi:TfoX/Sxy family transcriptional regulator of competence genes
MASDQSFADHVIDQLRGAGRVEARKMFGEYGIYCDDRIVALVCDNQLFVKPTEPGRAFIGTAVEAPPYPGAKPHFVVTEQLDDRDWLVELVGITVRHLPPPKPKKSAAPKKPPAAKAAGSSARARKKPAGKKASAKKPSAKKPASRSAKRTKKAPKRRGR